MARIRTIKPDHWEDDNWNDVSLQAHLLFLGMKNFADDAGVIRDNPVLIKNKVFPTREDITTNEVVKWLDELKECGFLVPLSYENKGYFILDFCDEKINKPQPSLLPDEAFLSVKNEIPECSGTFQNIPAGEERKGVVKERSSKGVGVERTSFIPPALDEVIEFFKEKNFSEKIARKAFDHYEQGNWHDTNGHPVKNWKQKMLSVWMVDDKQNSNQKNNSNVRKQIIQPTKAGYSKL